MLYGLHAGGNVGQFWAISHLLRVYPKTEAKIQVRLGRPPHSQNPTVSLTHPPVLMCAGHLKVAGLQERTIKSNGF